MDIKQYFSVHNFLHYKPIEMINVYMCSHIYIYSETLKTPIRNLMILKIYKTFSM